AMHADDEQIFMLVIVAIAHCYAHPVALPRQPRFLRDVAEGPVAIVAIKPVPVLGPRFHERRQRGAIHAKKIRPAVAVKIKHSQPARKCFHLVFASLRSIAQHKIQATRSRRELKPNRACAWMRRDERSREPGRRLRKGKPQERMRETAWNERCRIRKEATPTGDHRRS